MVLHPCPRDHLNPVPWKKPANAGVVTNDVFNSYLSDLSNSESDGSDGVNEPNSDPTEHNSTDNWSMPSAQD